MKLCKLEVRYLEVEYLIHFGLLLFHLMVDVVREEGGLDRIRIWINLMLLLLVLLLVGGGG